MSDVPHHADRCLHNLVVHPVMAILWLLGFRKLALWLHDATL